MVDRLTHTDTDILIELGSLPFGQASGALLSQQSPETYERASVVVMTNHDFSKWPSVFGNKTMATAPCDYLAHHYHPLETGNHSFRLKQPNIAEITARKTRPSTP